MAFFIGHKSIDKMLSFHAVVDFVFIFYYNLFRCVI